MANEIPGANMQMCANDDIGTATATNALLAPWLWLGRDLANGNGRDYAYYAGRVGPYLIDAGSITLTDDATNYVEVSTAGNVVVNTSAFTDGAVPLAMVTVADGTQAEYLDCRAWMDYPPRRTDGAVPPNTQPGTLLMGWSADWHEVYALTNIDGLIVTNNEGLILASEVS